MNSKYIFIFYCFLLSSCFLNLEQKMGAIAYENNCLSNIDIYDTNTLKNVFSLKKHESKIGTFIIEQGNHAIDNPPFFIDNGIKKYFLLKIYSNHRYKFIACPEYASPVDDSNWIKAN